MMQIAWLISSVVKKDLWQRIVNVRIVNIIVKAIA